MADLLEAIQHVMDWEDSKLTGEVTTGTDGRTRFGISERAHSWAADMGFYTTMPYASALGLAEAILAAEYAVPMQVKQIASQQVANKLLSLGVNVGTYTATKWLQEAVGAIPDGVIGAETLALLAKSDQKKVLDSLKQQAVNYYQSLAQKRPEFQKYLDGWLNRARA